MNFGGICVNGAEGKREVRRTLKLLIFQWKLPVKQEINNNINKCDVK